MQIARRPYPVFKDDLVEDAMAILHPLLAEKPGESSAGSWISADGRWAFSRRTGGKWIIFGGLEGQKLLDSYGLATARFPTRRQAIAALEEVLANADIPCD